jgi:D-xylose transport system substrate-binding protein
MQAQLGEQEVSGQKSKEESKVSKRKVWALLGLGLVALVIAGCGSSKSSSSSTGASSSTPAATTTGKGDIAVLLPDTQSSVRWEQFDRKYLGAAFAAAGVSYTIVNAQGDPTTQRSLTSAGSKWSTTTA